MKIKGKTILVLGCDALAMKVAETVAMQKALGNDVVVISAEDARDLDKLKKISESSELLKKRYEKLEIPEMYLKEVPRQPLHPKQNINSTKKYKRKF